MPDSKVYVGFDLGGTKMLALMIDAENRVIAQSKVPTEGVNGAEKGLEKIAQMIQRLLSDTGRKISDVLGIGIGCPGMVNPTTGVLRYAPNLGWKDVAVGETLGKRFKCPVAVLNDVDAGTYGEYVLGAGKGSTSLLGVFPGTGVGAGFVFDGKLIQGKNVSAMEMGLIRLPGTGLGSGARGHVMLEDLCSRLAIAGAAGIAAFRGRSSVIADKSDFDIRQIKSKTLASAVKAKEKEIIRILNDAVRYMSFGVAAAIQLLAPDKIVLGGGLVEELPEFFVKKLSQQVKKVTMPTLYDEVDFVEASLGDQAVAMGAAAYAKKFQTTSS